MDYYSTGIEARQRYDEMLQQAEKNRRANRVVAQASQPRSGLMVRAGDTFVSIGEWLRRRDNMTYAYGKR
jgi:hypothetical protein